MPRTTSYKGSMHYYEDKLDRVMQRFNATDVNYAVGKAECFVEFRVNGTLYRFDHSVEKAADAGIRLKRGSDVFAQLVLALEDLARLTERGIYHLQTWLSGLKYLPPAVTIPSFLQSLGFTEMPAGTEEVRARYRTLAKQLHPDNGGTDEDFHNLQDAAERAMRFMETRS